MRRVHLEAVERKTSTDTERYVRCHKCLPMAGRPKHSIEATPFDHPVYEVFRIRQVLDLNVRVDRQGRLEPVREESHLAPPRTTDRAH